MYSYCDKFWALVKIQICDMDQEKQIGLKIDEKGINLT